MFNRIIILCSLFLFGMVAHADVSTHFPFNESNGDIAFNTVTEANDGVLYNFTSYDPNKWVNGRISNGLKFDGLDDRVEFGEPVGGNSSYTIAFWVKAPPQNFTHSLYSEYNPAAWQPSLVCRGQGAAGNLIQFYSYDNNYSPLFNIITTKTVLDNSWHHVALVDNGGLVKLYIDGIVDVTASYTQSPVTRPESRLGANGTSPTNFFGGVIDEFYSYDAALEGWEVRALALQPHAEDEVTYLPLDETSGDLTYDAVVGESNVILSNFTSVDPDKWVSGRVGNGLKFDGVDDYVDIDKPVTTNEAYTISFWINAPVQDYLHTVYNEYDSQNGQPSFTFFGQSGPIQIDSFDNDSSTLFSVTSSATVYNGSWHHIGLTDSNGIVTLYIDGQVDATTSYTPSISLSRDSSRLGARNVVPTDFFDGKIDEVHTFDVALDEDSIKRLSLTTSRIAILRDDTISGLDLNLVDMVGAALEREGGHYVTFITSAELASSDYFNSSMYDMVVLTYSPGFPLDANDNFLNFLEGGGDAVFMGGFFPRLDVGMLELGINIFEDYEPYYMTGIKNVATCPNSYQELLETPFNISGDFNGISAIAPIHPGESKMIPLLFCEDKYGRDIGWGCSLKINFKASAHFYDSHWLIYGITSPAFYYEPAFLTSLVEMVGLIVGGNLSNDAWNEELALLAEELPLTTPPPSKTVRLTPDGKHFEYSDGTPCFLIGVNYQGTFDRLLFKEAKFTVRHFEEDFKKISETGINWIRIFGGNDLYTVPKELAAFKECARKYGIYLTLTIEDHADTYVTREETFNRGAEVAGIFADEPMVFSYDLTNEPYFWDFDIVSDYNGVHLYQTYPWASHGIYDMAHYEDIWLEAYDTPLAHSWHDSTFPGIDVNTVGGAFKDQFPSSGRLPVNADYEPVFDDVDGIHRDWTAWILEGVRDQDMNTLATIGYNTIYSLMPANEQLDYINQHTYRGIDFDFELWEYGDVIENVTTLDRMRLVWEDKPLVIGEFGYSNGYPCGDSYVDMYNSSIGEFMQYLYAFANGYDGVKKWKVNDQPLAMAKRLFLWTDFDNEASHLRQGRYGMFYYDGTVKGRPKPIAYALKFFRDYVDNYAEFEDVNERGTIEVAPSPILIKAVYEYEGPNALFVGDVNYTSDSLSFTSQKPANVLLVWDGNMIKAMSTSDATVRIKPSNFITEITSLNAHISGKHGSFTRQDEELVIEMLEGYVLEIVVSDADIDGSGFVNFFDFAMLSSGWGIDNSGVPGWISPVGDVNGDFKVDKIDLQILASQWLN